MLKFIESSKDLIGIELEIINSDSYFNTVSKRKSILTEDEIIKENKQSKEIGAERYLLHDGEEFVGIIEYLMRNPNDGEVWLGLLLIRKEMQSKGYGYKALQGFYEVLKEREKTKFRIGVIADNEPAHKFWKKQDFRELHTTRNQDNKEILIYEKSLTI